MSDRMYYSREAEERANRERMITIITFLLLGVGIGAALALLFAPRSGERTREQISSTVTETLEQSERNLGETVKQLSRDLLELRKSIEDRIEKMR
ncbi:MAG: YtxH domain-containing protein [Aggregatilineales bacterium]|jgi:hypothetical protein